LYIALLFVDASQGGRIMPSLIYEKFSGLGRMGLGEEYGNGYVLEYRVAVVTHSATMAG